MVHESQQQSVNKSAKQTRELVRRLGKLTEAQAAMGWGIVLLIITLVGAIYLNQSSRVALVGRHVQQLEGDLTKVQRVNAEIERDIAEAQALERLHKESERLGFVSAGSLNIEYMVVPDYPEMAAAPVALVTRQKNPARTVETIRDALQIVLQDRIDDLMRGESSE